LRRRKIYHIIIFTVAITISLFIVAAAALHNPRIQTKVVKKLATIISNKIDLPVEIGYVNILWYDELYIKQISIRDTQGEELIDVDKITVNFSLSSLFNKTKIHIDDTWISGARVSLRNNAPDSLMNISYFARSGKSCRQVVRQILKHLQLAKSGLTMPISALTTCIKTPLATGGISVTLNCPISRASSVI
jgi:hypothetical protein